MGVSNRGAINREGIVHGGKCPGGKHRGELPGGEVSGHRISLVGTDTTNVLVPPVDLKPKGIPFDSISIWRL